MNWDRLIAFVTLLVDVGILWILIKEFNYDKIQAEKQHYKKKKKEVEQPISRDGTSNIPRKTTGEVCDLPKTSVDVQAKIESGS